MNTLPADYNCPFRRIERLWKSCEKDWTRERFLELCFDTRGFTTCHPVPDLYTPEFLKKLAESKNSNL